MALLYYNKYTEKKIKSFSVAKLILYIRDNWFIKLKLSIIFSQIIN